MVKSSKATPSTSDAKVDGGTINITQPSRKKKNFYFFSSLSAGALLISFGCYAWISDLIPQARKLHAVNLTSSPVFVQIPEIIANLASNDGQDRYAKIKIDIQVKNSTDANYIRANMPKLIDIFETYLRAIHSNELYGAVGTYRLKEALLHRAYVVAAPVHVQNILFEELVVQ